MHNKFTEFINNELAEYLELNGIHGISCETVHPLIKEYVATNKDITKDEMLKVMSPLQLQVARCCASNAEEAVSILIEHGAVLPIMLGDEGEGEEEVMLAFDFDMLSDIFFSLALTVMGSYNHMAGAFDELSAKNSREVVRVMHQMIDILCDFAPDHPVLEDARELMAEAL